MMAVSSFDSQDSEKDIAPWMPDVAKMVRLQVFGHFLKDFVM